MEKKYRKILGQGVGVSQRFGWARKLVVGLMVGVVTLVGFSSCENNLLDVLGRDVFFRNVVDPYSIRVDFENRSSLNVSADTPFYIQLYGLIDGVVTNPTANVVIGPINSNTKSIIISKDELDTLGNNYNGYLLYFLYNLHRADFRNPDDYIGSALFSRANGGFIPDFLGVYNNTSQGSYSYNLFSALARDGEGSPLSNPANFTGSVIAETSILQRGKQYDLIIDSPFIAKDRYEPDNNILQVNTENRVNDWLLVGETQERTIHWGDADFIIFKPEFDIEDEELVDTSFTFSVELFPLNSMFEDPDLLALDIDNYHSFVFTLSLERYFYVGVDLKQEYLPDEISINIQDYLKDESENILSIELKPSEFFAIYATIHTDETLAIKSVGKYRITVEKD